MTHPLMLWVWSGQTGALILPVRWSGVVGGNVFPPYEGRSGSRRDGCPYEKDM